MATYCAPSPVGTTATASDFGRNSSRATSGATGLQPANASELASRSQRAFIRRRCQSGAQPRKKAAMPGRSSLVPSPLGYGSSSTGSGPKANHHDSPSIWAHAPPTRSQ